MRLIRKARPLLGREQEVQKVVQSLLQHSAAVIWGGPGEGKSSVATEAACRLWEAGKCESGCFEVDLQGVFPSCVWCSACVLFCRAG